MAHDDDIAPVNRTSRIGPIHTPTSMPIKAKKETKIEDTLAPSDAAALLAMFYSGFPKLPNIETVKASAEVANSEIGLNVLRAWGDNQRAIAEQIAEEQKSPAGRARKEEERSLREGLDRSITDYSQAVTRGSSAAKEQLPFVVGSFVISPDYTGYIAGLDTVSTSMVKASAVLSMVRDISNHLEEVIPANYKAVVEVIAATMINGLRMEATLRALATNNKAEATDPKNIVIQLARRALELAKGEALSHFFPNQPRVVAMLKLIILTASLAALYKFLLGGVSADELKGLLKELKNNKTTSINVPLLNSLLLGIDAQLQLLGKDSDKAWNSILSYIGSGPNLEEFFNVKDLIRHLYKANQYGGGLFEVD